MNGRQLYNATTSLDRKLTGNINEVAAVGTFYRPNRKMMVLISGSFGNNENLIENIRRNQAVQNIDMAGTVPFFFF